MKDGLFEKEVKARNLYFKRMKQAREANKMYHKLVREELIKHRLSLKKNNFKQWTETGGANL